MDTIKLETPKYIRIADIRPAQHCYFVKGKITSAEKKEITRLSGDKVTVCEGVIADESGAANFHFEGEAADLVNNAKGLTVSIRNGRCEVVDEHIRLEVDRFGKVAKEDKEVISGANTTNNISSVAYERKQSDRRGRA